jgi:hypothetical protein
MPTDTQPNLGYGQPTEVSINAVNQWMRSQPWYQGLLKSWGQDPNNVHLNDQQKAQIIRQAQANGVVVDQGNMEVDPSGNFNPVGHKLRNTLIVAGLAAATIGTMGAAGAFSGAAAGAMGAGAGGGAGAAAGTAGTLAGIEGGAAGIGSGALGALGTGAMGATALPALGAGAAGMGAAGAGGSSILGTLGKVAANKGGDLLTNAAAGIGNERINDNFADQNASIANNRAILDSATFNRDLPSVQAHQVARGDLMSTMKDAAPTGDPRIDKFGGGGLRPSAFGPSTQQAGDELKRQALKNLLSGQGQINPQLTTPKRAGFGENALAGAGWGLNILDAYNRMGR